MMSEATELNELLEQNSRNIDYDQARERYTKITSYVKRIRKGLVVVTPELMRKFKIWVQEQLDETNEEYLNPSLTEMLVSFIFHNMDREVE
jgi:hypothetical protein